MAWVRSGITVMALGFVVSRFGLFLELFSAAGKGTDPSLQSHMVSTVVGVGLVVLGSAITLAALHNHRAYVRSLPAVDVPKLPVPWLTQALVLSLSLAGFFLAAYLTFA